MLIENILDASLNNSDKSWLVPDDETWRITHCCVKLITTATVGNRLICLQVRDPDGNEIKHLVPGNVQAASTTVIYCMIQGIYRETTVVNGVIEMPIPIDFYVLPGCIIRFYDLNAVAPAADDMTVSFQVEKISS